MRKLRRKQEKKRKSLNSIIKSSLVVGLTLTLAGQAYAQAVPTSDNLPVPNYVKGASLKYNSGLNVNSSVTPMSVAAREQAAKAADSSRCLDINVQAAAADLKYNTFNVGTNSKVKFNFSNKNQVALNRITSVGEAYASKVLGNISQTGQGGAVLLINPNGILFGPASTVNLNSFTASTLNYKSSDLNNKSITLERGELNPTGIYMKWGSKIITDKGAVFASNGIYNEGGDIFAQSGNIQLITGDGVNFTCNEVFKPNIISQENVKASTVNPNDVEYPYYRYGGYVSNKESSIYTDGSKILGENLNFVSKVSLNDPIKAIINLDGIIEAKQGTKCESGNIIVYSNGISNINTDIKADGNIKLEAKNINTDNIVSGGTIDIYGNNVNTNSITADGNIKMSGELNTTDITSGNNVNLYGTMSTGNITALNEIILASKSFIHCKQLNSGGNIDVESGGLLSHDINTKGNIKIFTGENETRIGNVKASGYLDIFSFGRIHTKNLHTGGKIDATTAFGAITTGNIFANKDISIGGESGVITKDVVGNANVALTGGFSHVNVGNIKAKGNLYIGSHWRDITTGNLYSDKNITVRNSTMFDPVNIVSLGDLTAKEKVYVSAVDIANIQNIKAGDDILIEAKSLNTNSPDNFIKTTGYYSNILINADEMFMEKDGTALRPGVMSNIELSRGTLILGPRYNENVELIGTNAATAVEGTSFIFSDVYNALKSKSEVPKVAVAHLFDNPININAKDHFLGRIKDGQAKPKHLILSTKGNVDFEFTSAHPDSTLTVDHCRLKPELIDRYGNIDITKPLVIEGYEINNLNKEANNVRVIDATKDPGFDTFDQNFFSNNPAELIKL